MVDLSSDPTVSFSAHSDPSSAFDRAMQTVVTGIVGLGLVIYILVPFLALNWIQHPFLGGFIESTTILNETGSHDTPMWPAFEAGLRAQDRIVQIGNRAVADANSLNAAVAMYPVGAVVPVKAMRVGANGLEEVVTVSIPLTAFGGARFMQFFVVPYLIGLAYFLTGLWVFWLRRNETSGRLFALFCTVAAVASGGLFDIWTVHAFHWAWVLAMPAVGAALVTLSLVFPQEIHMVQHRPGLRLVSFLPGLALSAFALYALYGAPADPRLYVTAWRYTYYYLGVGALFFFGMVLYRSVVSPSPVAREQSRIILIGAVAGFVPLVFWALSPLLGLVIPFGVLPFLLPLILFPFTVAYAVLRYRLLDTDVVLGQGLIYAAMSVLVTVAFGVLLTGLGLALGTMFSTSNPAVIGLLVFLLVATFNPLRGALQRLVDSTFYRGTQDTQSALARFGRDLSRAVTLEDIHRALDEPLQNALRPEHFYLFLRDPLHNDYSAFAFPGQPAPTDLRFSANSSLVAALSKERAAVYLAPEVPLPSNLLAERARLVVLGSALFAPLPGQAGLVGWLAVGPKLSGEAFRREDVRFVEALADQSSLAVERTRSIFDLQRRVQELNVLSQMAQAVNFTLTYDDLLELIYAQASKIVAAPNFYIILKDDRTDAFVYAFYLENNERVPEQENHPWQVGRGLATEVARTGQAIRTDDYLEECRRRHVQPRGKAFKAWLGVPLNSGAETIGVMCAAQTKAGQPFTEEQLKVFVAVADQAASALLRAQLFRQSETRARQLATLNEISASMASTLELEPLLARIVKSAVQILAGEAGSLFLTDEETGESVFRVAESPIAHSLVGMRIAPGKGFVGQAVESGEALIVNDVQNDPRWYKGTDQETGFITRAMMVIPLRRGGRRVGAIQVLNKKDGTPFTQDDQNLLTIFSGQAAVAIENARLFTQTDQKLAARVEELSMMQRIDRELNMALDVKRVMGTALDWAMRNTQASAGAVGVVLEHRLSVIASQGYDDSLNPLLQPPLPLDAGVLGQVVRSGERTLVRGVRNNFEAQLQPLLPDTETLLVLPIKRERETVGLITLESPAADAFSIEQIDFVTRLVDHASVAFTNARLYAEVQAANLAKSEFVSFVAHELKTPMQSIKMSAELLVADAVGPTNDMQKQFLETIRRNLDRLATIVTDLNDITRIETGRLRLTLKPFDFAEVLDSVVQTTEGLFASKRQRLTLTLAPDLPPVSADLDRTVQVLTNLLSNAYKYTPEEGEVTLHARISETDPSRLHVSIKDTGIGIAPEDQKKLFQKFYRATDQMARDMAAGTGLGLNIVKNLVELQGGQIWFESEFRRGSTFHFTLAIAPEAETNNQ